MVVGKLELASGAIKDKTYSANTATGMSETSGYRAVRRKESGEIQFEPLSQPLREGDEILATGPSIADLLKTLHAQEEVGKHLEPGSKQMGGMPLFRVPAPRTELTVLVERFVDASKKADIRTMKFVLAEAIEYIFHNRDNITPMEIHASTDKLME